jgi:uncharacterized protein (DUF362 family)
MAKTDRSGIGRRDFFRTITFGGLGAAIIPGFTKRSLAQSIHESEKPTTNIADALKYPRTSESLPGKYPGKVIQLIDDDSYKDDAINQKAVFDMLAKGMLSLTGAATLNEAWLQLVKPGERIGLKVNPIAGQLLSTSHELVASIISQLEDAGISRSSITIWDRREFQLHEAGFTEDRYPGIRIVGTECKDANGSFYGSDGKLLSESRIDTNWYYWADVEMEYDEYTLPYMVNSGKHSYFTKILTQEIDKVINIPILKNAGSSITLCLKNLGYGVITNTSRLHAKLWGETSAQVCAFPPVRDKVVLNIVDGIVGCYQGGPAANPQFIIPFKTMLLGTDPVAVDRIGYDIVINKRIEMGVQESDTDRGKEFMLLASNYQLGESDIEKIDLQTINLS